MVTVKIRQHYSMLTPAERKVASFVMARPDQVITMAVGQIAERCSVAPSAVVRFCKSVGVRGFSELKLTLASELGSHKLDDQIPAVVDGNSTELVVRKVFCSGMQTLRDTLDLLDFEKIESMADALARAKRIFTFGIGTSSVIANDAQYRLSQLGLWATAYTDVLMMNVAASNLGEGDVVLAISHSGRTKAVVDAVRRAKSGGAYTMAITSFQDSTLYRDCEKAAFVFADEANYPVEAVSARVAHTCLLDSLTMVLATRNLNDFADHIKARNKILEEIRYK